MTERPGKATGRNIFHDWNGVEGLVYVQKWITKEAEESLANGTSEPQSKHWKTWIGKQILNDEPNNITGTSIIRYCPCDDIQCPNFLVFRIILT